MPKAKYESIYHDLKHKIEQEEYAYQDLMPSENRLTEVYGCSRNTIRRALSELASIGYLQPMHGKGVRVIYTPVPQSEFLIGGIESFKESAARNHLTTHTKVIRLEELSATRMIAKKTGFPEGSLLYELHRIRYLDDQPLILDINFFLQELVPNLTVAIAEKSIYDYIENELGMPIATSRRHMTVEHATREDESYLALGDYNCLAVITGRVFNADGIQFEYTQSRHRPDFFCFQDTAIRTK